MGGEAETGIGADLKYKNEAVPDWNSFVRCNRTYRYFHTIKWLVFIIEELAVDHYLFRKLNEGIKELNETEQKMVQILFFENMTEREAAASCGVSQPAVNKCKNKILNKLRNYLNSYLK